MLKKRFWVAPLAALVVVSLLFILGGFAIHRLSWSQGYRMGQLAAGGEGVTAVPYGLHGFGYPGPFITIGLLFLLLMVMGKIFRFCVWRIAGGPWMMASGPKGAHWARHWHRPHGPMPPWCWGWEQPSEEKAEQAEPGAESGTAKS